MNRVYFDGIHLMADDINYLHLFAQRIGLKKNWFQNNRFPHYDAWGEMAKKIENHSSVVRLTQRKIKG